MKFAISTVARETPKNACQKAFDVLVVDDSAVARKLVEHALPKEEFRVLPAKTGLEAVELFALHRPGLVITDWLMPDLGGVELCQRLRSGFKDSFTYVILLTSLAEKSNVVKGLRAGADDYLTKPFDAEELLARASVGRRFVELHRQIEAQNRFLQRLALTDDLTGLPNRRALEQWATKQMSGAVRHDFPFCLVMADLDEFKSINDAHGHGAGDAVLKKFAEILQINTRQSDICGRIGGDEFLMVITHSEEDGVKQAIERIREQVEAQRFTFGGQDVGITASFGVASLNRGQNLDFQRMIVQTDVALHSAKRRGRNRVEVVPPELHSAKRGLALAL
jgi:diguanylate cyclase (GGDEF)-like protein